MNFINENLLTILILLPVVGAVLTLGHQMFWKQEGQLKWLTLGFTLVNFAVSLLLFTGSAPAGGYMFEKNVPWKFWFAVAMKTVARVLKTFQYGLLMTALLSRMQPPSTTGTSGPSRHSSSCTLVSAA